MRRTPVVPFVLALVGLLRAWSPQDASAQSFASGVSQGVVDPSGGHISEGSGMVLSRQNPGVAWIHNDNNWAGSIFAIATNGAYLGRFYIPTVFSGDFEDIAIGPGPNPEFQYVYLGDIGDNFFSRSQIFVYRFPEPAAYGYFATGIPLDQPLQGVQTITLIYPDGPHDAEALMIDPLTGDLFIVTKEDTGQSTTVNGALYRATRAQLDSGASVTLTKMREIAFSGFRNVSAGDISFDGRLITMRRNARVWMWNRSASQTVSDALAVAGSNVGTPTEANGEGIGFHPTGLGYYTHSEGYAQTNYFYRRTDTTPRQPVVFVRPGETWRYQDAGTNLGTAWRQTNFNDSAWASGAGQLGYGEGDEATVISFGPDDFFKNTTTYFRKRFSHTPSGMLSNLALRVCFNDGIAVYLNGVEVMRRNLATNAGYADAALADNSARQNVWFSSPVSPSLIRAGNNTNTLAVEVHRFDPSGPTLSFDLQLLEGPVEAQRRFTSAPRLTNNLCRINVAGPVGSMLTIDASANLQNWSLAGQTVLTNGTNVFQEAIAPGTTQRFYRIRQ
jgi:hypothetical protein